SKPTPMVHIPLFGGACSITLPNDFVDVSKIRQVPDNQEVFVQSTSDACFIIELVEAQSDSLDASTASEATAPAEAAEMSTTGLAEFHFDQIAKDNDATFVTLDVVKTGLTLDW